MTSEAAPESFTLDNGTLRAVLGRDGTLRSLVLGGREAMAAAGNVLELYDDNPTDFEAWDLDPFHLETRADCPPATSAEVALADPLRVEVAFERPIGERSRMRQVVRLDAEASRLEFRCAIDWREERTALKVRFPVAVHAPRATYEMQFGVVERPTHFSTRRDAAQYEVPGHRFADLSEHGFGVALLSAATYGWSTLRNEMRMTLLRSPQWPDPQADVGEHELAFAIYPHQGGWQDGGVTAEALRFNAPLLLGAGDGRAPLLVLHRRVRPARRHRQAGRGRRRGDRPPLRGPRRPRDRAPARRRARSARRGSRTCSRTGSGTPRSRAPRSSSLTARSRS